MANTEPATVDTQLAEYRARWEQRHPDQAARPEDFRAAYQFAWDLAHTPGIQYGRATYAATAMAQTTSAPAMAPRRVIPTLSATFRKRRASGGYCSPKQHGQWP